LEKTTNSENIADDEERKTLWKSKDEKSLRTLKEIPMALTKGQFRSRGKRHANYNIGTAGAYSEEEATTYDWKTCKNHLTSTCTIKELSRA
jgi:hypothetical protein